MALALLLVPAATADDRGTRTGGPASGSPTVPALGPVVGVRQESRVQLLPGGFGVTLDAQTRRIRAATPAEMAGLLSSLAASGTDGEVITIVHFGGGARAAILPASTMESTRAVRRPDGRVVIECGTDRTGPARSHGAASRPPGQPSPLSSNSRPAELR